MADYRTPGVYVEEKLSGSAPIIGVGTSTAGFIGVVVSGTTPASSNPGSVTTASQSTIQAFGSATDKQTIGTGDGEQVEFELPKPEGLANAEVVTDSGFAFFVGKSTKESDVSIQNRGDKAFVTFATAPGKSAITGYYQLRVPAPVPVATTISSGGSSTIAIAPSPPDPTTNPDTVAAGEVQLCTNFSEFKKYFWDFSKHTQQNYLAHAVFGFFRNGGTSCYVVWVEREAEIQSALESFATIDEIAIVAAPGVTDKDSLQSICDHCEQMGDRVAILDTPEIVGADNKLNPGLLKPGETLEQGILPGDSDYAALYFPWLQVYDPASNNKRYFVPPSGHMAGIYARVDAQRGVYKAPANETVLGATGLKYSISKTLQADLNDRGVNCIRFLNGNIRVWGARTLGGKANGEFMYINVRRLFNYLRESIDEGTQWTVFEPNAPDLWARIRRNVTAFLLMVWRSGALFGSTPEEAFYVKCDEETNPPEARAVGQVVTEIGVAVVRPAEFVIFRITQWDGPGGS